MRVSLNWLKEFVDLSISPRDLSNILTMAGLEVEGTEERDGDMILDVSVTPNRPDCLSIIGIARELSAVLQIPIRYPAISVPEDGIAPPSIEIMDTDLCHRYVSRMIYGVKVGESPEWLIKRLESLGIRSVNNIVDITNYVLLEMGHPLHAFDLERLEGKRVIVKRAGTVSRFHTLDGIERLLDKEILMIWDSIKPVAIAGIMGGMNSEITPFTTNILLESAYFEPTSIRRASRSLNLVTEASYRFERGADIDITVKALDRATFLIKEMAGGRVSGVSDNYPVRFKPYEVCVEFKKINALLGIDIDMPSVEAILKRLGFSYKRVGEGFVVVPPSYRRDIQRDVDVIEEVGRLHGYEKIPSSPPVIKIRRFAARDNTLAVNMIKEGMIKSGFTEVINPSFMNPSSLDGLNISHDDNRRKGVRIKNPLKKEDACLRTTLIPSLLNTALLNQSRGERSFRFFEVSRVFFDRGDKLPEEIIQMAGIHCKSSTPSIWQRHYEGFYDTKGAIENLFTSFKIKDYSFEDNCLSVEPYLHPAKSCMIRIDKRIIGSIGVLHPSVASLYELKGDISIFEITNLKALMESIPSSLRFKPLPRYPYIERDISIMVDKGVTFSQIKRIILDINTELIESIELFDIYTGSPIPREKKSIAFTMRYRASDRTLTDEEIADIHSEVINRLKESIGAELRG